LVEVEVADFLTPGTRPKHLALVLFSVTASLKGVKEVGVALVHLDEVGVLVHQLEHCLVLLFVLTVKSLDRNLGQAKQLGELVVIISEVLCLVEGHTALVVRMLWHGLVCVVFVTLARVLGLVVFSGALTLEAAVIGLP